MPKIPENIVSIRTVYTHRVKRPLEKPSVPVAVENDSGLVPVDVFLRKLAAKSIKESFSRFSSDPPSDDAS